MTAFSKSQRHSQIAFFSRFQQDHLMPGWAYRLIADEMAQNLNPAFRQDVLDHFSNSGSPIQWHQHSNHALSSQVCCVNFFAPLMRRPETLARVIGSALGIATPQMLPVGRNAGGDIFVDFEWVGLENHLGEWPETGRVTRGANATSADAIVRMADPEGTITTILIEWKYTESYGTPLDPKRNPTRLGRYSDKAFAPDGPIRADIGLTVSDFFWEPFYQLLRQQMLAWCMEKAKEAGASRVMVLHISAAGNATLHRVTAPALQSFGSDAFDVFRSLLVNPSRFHATSIESVFRPVVTELIANDPADAWASYLIGRYTFLAGTDGTTHPSDNIRGHS